MSMIIRPITQLSRSGKAANSARQALSAKATINPGIPSHAHQLFDEMPKENSAAFDRLFISYTRNNHHREALVLFLQARQSERPINDSTVSSIVKSCGALLDFNLGKQFHIEHGRRVFDLMHEKDCVAWNTMLGNLVLNGLEAEALQLFNELRDNSAKPTIESYAAVIKLCANLKQLLLGPQLHSCMIKEGFESDNYVMTMLMMTYIKCMKLDQAFQVFSSMPGDEQNVVSWTAIISAYVQNKDPIKVASLFREMRRDCVEPNDFTYSTLLTASPAISPFQIHALVIKSYYHHVPSVGTALLTAYSKLGNTHESLAIFKTIDAKDVVAWSAMLSSHAQTGHSDGAVNLFKEMVMQSVKPMHQNLYIKSSTIDI